MTIIINLGKTAAKQNLQNIARANGWSYSDEKETLDALAKRFEDQIDIQIKQGQKLREQDEIDAKIEEKTRLEREDVDVSTEV